MRDGRDEQDMVSSKHNSIASRQWDYSARGRDHGLRVAERDGQTGRNGIVGRTAELCSTDLDSTSLNEDLELEWEWNAGCEGPPDRSLARSLDGMGVNP